MQANADTHYGVYLVSGDTMALTFATGEVETLKADGADWLDSQKTLTKVQTLANGAALTGSISSSFYTGFTPGTGVEGGIASSSSTEFFADGSYKGESFGGAFGNFESGGFTTSNEGASGGTYVVRDGMVISTPANGAAPTAALALRVDDENILIGDQYLEVSK